MALDSSLDLPQLRPAPLSRPAAPVPACVQAGTRESRGGGGLARLAALAIFAAGIASAVAFKDNIRPASHPPALPSPAAVVVARIPAARVAAPALQSLVRSPSGAEVVSSPLPFYGEADRVSAAGADTEALPAEQSQAAPNEIVSLVPLRAQEQPATPRPKTFQDFHLQPMAFFIQVASAKGVSAGGLRLLGVENVTSVRIRSAVRYQGSASFGEPACPCNIRAH